MENNYHRKESRYKSQMKYLRKNYKHFNIDFRIDLFNKFQEICKKNNTTPTTEIKKFVNYYIEKHS